MFPRSESGWPHSANPGLRCPPRRSGPHAPGVPARPASRVGACPGLCYTSPAGFAPGLGSRTAMELIESHLETSSDEFKANAAHQRALAAELKEKLAAVKQGGGADLVKRHAARGKLFVRDRVERLLDPGSAFLEL